jgi:hypothetical protein
MNQTGRLGCRSCSVRHIIGSQVTAEVKPNETSQLKVAFRGRSTTSAEEIFLFPFSSPLFQLVQYYDGDD